jgi:hypothetical protein
MGGLNKEAFGQNVNIFFPYLAIGVVNYGGLNEVFGQFALVGFFYLIVVNCPAAIIHQFTFLVMNRNRDTATEYRAGAQAQTEPQKACRPFVPQPNKAGNPKSICKRASAIPMNGILKQASNDFGTCHRRIAEILNVESGILNSSEAGIWN